MGFITSLVCDSCGRSYPDSEIIFECPRCGGMLECQYDYDGIRNQLNLRDLRSAPRSIWRWKDFLPVRDARNIVTLGEGGTPLLKCERLAQKLGLRNLYVKNDTINPTATFKDRTFSVAVSKAKELGVTSGITYTSGNAGASLCAYAARSGLVVTILVNEWATNEKVAMLLTFGQRVIKITWKSFAEVSDLVEGATNKLKMYQFVNFVNPYRHEGTKTFAYEIAEEMNWVSPDWVAFPIGTGGGIWGSWKGFNELRKVGLLSDAPRMIGVQPEVCAPVIKAVKEGKEVAEKYGNPERTMAQSIASDAPFGMGRKPIRAIRESRGLGSVASDDEIIEATKWLGLEGVFSEPAGGATVAGVKRLVDQGQIDKDEKVVCIITGSGLKQPEFMFNAFPKPPTIGAKLDELTALLGIAA